MTRFTFEDRYVWTYTVDADSEAEARAKAEQMVPTDLAALRCDEVMRLCDTVYDGSHDDCDLNLPHVHPGDER